MVKFQVPLPILQGLQGTQDLQVDSDSDSNSDSCSDSNIEIYLGSPTKKLDWSADFIPFDN